jgi:hypothetical protein
MRSEPDSSNYYLTKTEDSFNSLLKSLILNKANKFSADNSLFI